MGVWGRAAVLGSWDLMRFFLCAETAKRRIEKQKREAWDGRDALRWRRRMEMNGGISLFQLFFAQKKNLFFGSRGDTVGESKYACAHSHVAATSRQPRWRQLYLPLGRFPLLPHDNLNNNMFMWKAYLSYFKRTNPRSRKSLLFFKGKLLFSYDIEYRDTRVIAIG